MNLGHWPIASLAHRRSRAALTTAGAAALSVALSAQPQFRASVNVATIDVAVVDKNGSPVAGLTPEQFTVKLGGKVRKVALLDYRFVGELAAPGGIDLRPAQPGLPSPAAAFGPRVAWDGGRTMLLVLDDLSYLPKPAQQLGNGIERMLPSLATVDRLGFVSTSGRSPSIHPTADHAAVLTAVKRVSGQRADETAPFFIGVGEALAMQRGVRSVVKEVLDRECGTSGGEINCPERVARAARALADSTLRRTQQQVEALTTAITWMAAQPEPRVIVWISAGFAADPAFDLGAQLRGISAAAATAGVALYGMTGLVDDIDMRDMSYLRTRARRLEGTYLNHGLQTLVAAAGGESFLVAGQPDRFFNRILNETSAVYRLAVSLTGTETAKDLTEIRVTVDRRDVTMRVRPRSR
jgi:VWFA-related protein